MNISSHTVKDIFNIAFSQKANKPFIVFKRSQITYGELKQVFKGLLLISRKMELKPEAACLIP